MSEKKMRKTDRRSLYTKNVIKDSMLELMEETPYEQLSVTAICKKAEITRSTFYLHYDNLNGVLDELIEDALHLAESGSENPIADLLQMLDLVSQTNDPDYLSNYDSLLPPCQRIADQPKYRVLFTDEMLSNYIVNKIYHVEKDIIIPKWSKYANLSMADTKLILLFLMNGSYAVNKALNWKKDADWYDTQKLLLRFILGGFDALKKDL